MTLEELAKKKILLLGFTREGRDTLLFLRKKFPKKVIGIADQNKHVFRGRKKYVIWHTEKNYLEALKNYEVIIKSPGIPTWKITPFLKKNHTVTSQTEIFFDNCPGIVIGVTGTKGKSTTSSLIHAVLKEGGFNSHLIGNIEKPALQFLHKARPDDIFVYELSSFQLTSLKRSPTIAIFLNLYPEHLDYYRGNFAAYAAAKANITKYQTQTDFLIYNAKDPLVAKIAKSSKAQKIPFSPKAKEGLSLLSKGGTVPPIASFRPAILIGKLFGIPSKKIEKALKKFKPLPHRLEKVGEWKGITFYNDSLATIPEATCSALDSLGSKVRTLIAGGFDRGLAFEKLGKRIRESSIATLILFPTTGEKIWKEVLHFVPGKPSLCRARPNARTWQTKVGFPQKAKQFASCPQCFFASTMKEAIKLSYNHTPKGKICLLSPAASSFNMFKDYKDRGEQFKKLAQKYGEKT